MDIEIATGPPVRQASEEDLQGVLLGDFGASLSLLRNYGDRLDAVAIGVDCFQVRYYDAATGRFHEATSAWSLDQVKRGFADYFQGNWNWHSGASWRAVE